MDFDHFFESPGERRIRKDPPNLKWDRRFLQLADTISTWSKDPSSQIGCVVVDPSTRRILSTGYNGFPRGIRDTADRLENREQKYKLVVHAEQNAIYNATMNGVSLAGSTMYVVGLPSCSDCAKGIIQVGIKRVVCGFPKELAEKWAKSWQESVAMYNEAKVEVIFYNEWK